MSIHSVSRHTIDAIVQAAIQYNAPELEGINPKTNPDTLGTYLLNKSITSDNYKYHENSAPEQYWYTISDYDPSTLFGCIQYYDHKTLTLPTALKSQLPFWLNNLTKKIGTRDELTAQGYNIPRGL